MQGGNLKLYSMTFAQRRNRQMTHFSEPIPVVKRSMTVFTILTGICRLPQGMLTVLTTSFGELSTLYTVKQCYGDVCTEGYCFLRRNNV